ncbi:hypothetical protein Glove_161g56 [Diversispora epigaea]|uniref:SAM domain-containing protein n=1 Tax=Diversispora epigaea TaxID=1348612 RepID=A0A397IRI6_9GLOM|nr:hypothetical protein Glove_161g56 [Diversispora epigaea]
MSFNVAGSSTSVPVIPDLPTVEEVRGFNAEKLNRFLKGRLNNIDSHIDTLTAQEVDGEAFLELTSDDLTKLGILLGPVKKILRLINGIQGEYIQENNYLKYHLFLLELANTKNSASVYRHVRECGVVQLWQIEEDIIPLKRVGNEVFNKYRNTPAQGLSEITINQPFCMSVVNKINDTVNLLQKNKLLVVGNNSGRREDEVFPDIIIGPISFYSELTKNLPNLSKGLGWKVKNNLNDGSKVIEGKGQLLKYARTYLSANPPLTSIFYGCLTDGKLWQFMKIQFILEDINNLKVKFEESRNYEWSEHTASLIAGLIDCYHNDLLIKVSDEKKEFQNNNKIYMYRNKSLISPKSLLASFIEKGIYIRLNSGNCIHVQITSLLGTGRECIVFLAQVRDCGIKDAVLKIEVYKNTTISQVYCEISVLHALRQPLELWISDNSNIDDYMIFQIILDLLSCLENIHAHNYTHGDVAIRNVIQRNGHFYLIDFGLATPLYFHSNPCQAIIQDYSKLCQIIGIIKFEKKMSFSELIDKLKGELKLLVALVDDASKWKITDKGKWLEKFNTKVKQFYKRSSKKKKENIIL